VAAEAGLVSMILSDPIVSELREKLIEKFNVPQEDADAIGDHLKTYAELVSAPGRSGWVAPDPDDDKFIDTALAAGAGIIVSGDRHLLDLGTIEGIEILTARQFLDRLPALSEDGDSTTH
jgi:predicted nucleic acid-binding protein